MKSLLNNGVTEANVDRIIKDVPTPSSAIAAKRMISPKSFAHSAEIDVNNAEIVSRVPDATIVTADIFRKNVNVLCSVLVALVSARVILLK